MPTDLTHIQDTLIDQATLHNFSHSFALGPLTIKYGIDTTVPQIDVDVYILGVRIGGETVTVHNTSLTVQGAVSRFKAQVALSADFSKKILMYDVEVCAPTTGCKHYTGTLFSW